MSETTWHLYPRLKSPDWNRWREHFPRGLGGSVFSSPAWQALMRDPEGGPCTLQWLQARASGGRTLSLPVHVRTNRWGRLEINVRPVAYYVTPIECDPVDEEVVSAILSAVRAVFTAGFTWWLPPWPARSIESLAAAHAGPTTDVSSIDTYVITLDRPVDEYLRDVVSETQHQQVRMSYRRGLEVLTNPPPDVIQEYYALYHRIYEVQNWIGPLFPAAFFEGIAGSMQEGGELVVMRLNGRVVGGGVLLFDRHAVHYFQGTTDRNVKNVFPHSVLIEIALRRAEALGLPYVNLGGVNDGNKGLIRFKQFWGARPTPVPAITFHCRRGDLLKRLRPSRSRARAAATKPVPGTGDSPG